MKKLILLFAAAFFTAAASAQEWKLSPVWEDALASFYVSFAYPDTENGFQGAEFFTMWGYKDYTDESLNLYEAEYFRGTPREMHELLRGIRDFAERNKSGMAIADISGVQIKTLKHPVTGIYTCVYAPGGRDFCMYKAKKWAQVYDYFVGFCKDNGISYE